MKLFKKKLVLFAITAFFITANAQETFILNYEDVDIKKVTRILLSFQKKQLF